ncbi:MAG: AfsR/SARP family transcriptional regulator [Actinomycetota bacterium]|nr:AfsR/SARP family transcriptional regulator [Actinomycetota bacterium]
MRVELTGRLHVAADDGRVLDAAAFPGRQGRLVFAFLAANVGPVPREELAEMLWPAGPPSRWKRDLSVLVSKLRALLRSVGVDGSAALVPTAGCYELRLPAGSVVDVHAAAAHAAEAVRALREGEADQALAAAIAAADLGRRPLLAGEEAWWITGQRRELERARLAALDVAVQVLGERGDLARALVFAHEAVELAPFRESGYVSLMRLQLAAGDRAEALRTYERCRKLLADELGVDPAPETEAVYLQALRAHRQPVVEIGTALGMRDQGNLPAPVSTFVGRDREIEQVAAALGQARLVSLCGVGGVGKSRLALECAARLAAAYPDGVWQCELARVAGGDAVAHALAGALGVHERPERTLGGSLVDFLRPKEVLLLLDNCEHVLDAVGPLLQTLLRACPLLAVLATSRERLALDGEHVLPVEPLPVPGAGAGVLASTIRPAAVQLFCDRAAAACQGFALGPENGAAVAHICRRLDGLPLAIELAAARLRTVGVGELADRLDQRFQLLTGGPRTGSPRQRTLRGMVDWSYALLTDGERRVFDHLSVFAGSFTVEAAAAVCATVARTEEAIASLVDRSMVVVDTAGQRTRYRLLETLRMYGRERLAGRKHAEAARRRHAPYYVALAETAAEQLCGPDEAMGAAALEQEWDDLRAAHRWSTTVGNLDVALRLAAALYWYALFRMRAEAPAWAEQAASLPGADAHPLFPLACATAGVGCWARGELRRAVAFGRRGLQAAAGQPSRRFPLDVLGAVALFEGQLDISLDHFAHGVEAAAEAGDDYHRSHLLGDVALVRAYQGHADEALRAADEARRVARATANPSATAWSLYVDGEILAGAASDHAVALLDSSIDLARSVGSTFVLGVALVSASSVRGRHGDPHGALRMFLRVVEHWHGVGNWTQQWTTLRNVIELFVRLGADIPAAVLLGALRVADTAAPLFGTDAQRIAAASRLLESRLGRQRFTAATARGETMTGDQAVAFACTELRQTCTTLSA